MLPRIEKATDELRTSKTSRFFSTIIISLILTDFFNRHILSWNCNIFTFTENENITVQERNINYIKVKFVLVLFL